MFDNEKVGQRIAVLRKRKGITQEQLAEILKVTGQAVSKWEKGNAMPDIALLPALGKNLGVSVDLLLNPYDLFILEGKYGANGSFADVTVALNGEVGDCGLCMAVNNQALGADPATGIYKYVIVRYANANGVFHAFAGEGDALHIPPTGEGLLPYSDAGLEVLAARYGSELESSDVMTVLKRHLLAGKRGSLPVNHEWFPSSPGVDEIEYLSVLYRNREGLFVVAVPEGGAIALTSDGRFLTEAPQSAAPPKAHRIWGIEKLKWGQGRECTYAGALTAALRVMGEDVSYETVMGVSGACWRLAFCNGWDFSSVDGLVAYDHATPAWKAFGYDIKGYDRVEKKDREQVRSEIIDSINRGVPVLAIDLRVVPEWGVIGGYSDNGKTLWCRTYFDDEAEDLVKAEKWPFIIFFFGKKGSPPSPRESLLRSMALFVEEMNIPERRGYTMGYNAYEFWSAGLEDDDQLAAFDEGGFRHHMAVNHFCYLALVDARKAGAAYLKASLGLLEGEAAAHLQNAAELYAQIAEKLEAGWQWVPCEEQCKENPTAVWTSEKRHAQASLLREIAACEKEVEREFNLILKG